jgi:hypothetical protein
MDILKFKRTVLAKWFGGNSWGAWDSLLAAMFCLSMTPEMLEIFRKCTGRQNPPTSLVRELVLVVGRRGGKTLILALIAVFCAVMRKYNLVAGETGVVLCVARDKFQARVLLRYITAFITETPLLKQMVLNLTQESIELVNGITIIVAAASPEGVRGTTIVCALIDEAAFLPTGDSASPDRDLLNAIYPAQITIPIALTVRSSTAYAKKGMHWETFRDDYGREDAATLVWKAKTRTMNATVSRAAIAMEYLRDAVSARAEFGSQFRDDIVSVFSEEILRACVVAGRYELAPRAGVRHWGFCDPSGGRNDSFTFAVTHNENGRIILDLLREIPAPFNPEEAVMQVCVAARMYHLSFITGDNYSAEWCASAVERQGIKYVTCEKNRSQLYLELLPMVNSGEVELLDSPRLIAQFCGLERRTSRGGRDTIDHAPGPDSHDDCANAVAGAIVGARVAVKSALGVMTLSKKIGTLGRYLFALNANPAPPATSTTTTAPPVQFIVRPDSGCENCGEKTAIAKCSGRWRCNSCGFLWGDIYIAAPVTRADVLSGRHRAAQFKYPGQR